MIYFRFVHPAGWAQFKERIFYKSPALIKLIGGVYLSKKVTRRLKGGGVIGRLSVDELLRRAKTDLDTLSEFLSNKPYFFGEKISILDAIFLGVYGGIACVGIETPLKELADTYDNLKNHALKLLEIYY